MTRNRRTDICWILSSGPDASHLHDARTFATRRDARTFAEDLPLTPDGRERPYRLERLEFSPSSGLVTDRKVIDARGVGASVD